MDVHLDITDDRDVYVEEDNNMEVEKEVEKEVDEEVDKDVPIFVMHWYVSYWKQQKTQFVFHFQNLNLRKKWKFVSTFWRKLFRSQSRPTSGEISSDLYRLGQCDIEKSKKIPCTWSKFIDKHI